MATGRKYSPDKISDKVEGPYPLRLVRLCLRELYAELAATTAASSSGGGSSSASNAVLLAGYPTFGIDLAGQTTSP